MFRDILKWLISLFELVSITPTAYPKTIIFNVHFADIKELWSVRAMSMFLFSSDFITLPSLFFLFVISRQTNPLTEEVNQFFYLRFEALMDIPTPKSEPN